METGLVSVIMPAFNAKRYITDAVCSLLAQTYRQWELIVVNDGSTDSTPDIARAFADPRILVIDQPNGGEAGARNTALKHARGEYVAFLDADDLFREKHLESAVRFLNSNHEYEAVYADGYYCDESGSVLQTLSSRRLPARDGNIFDYVVRASCMLGPPLCVVLRQSAVKRRGLWFDERLVIGPDWDFFIRFSETARFKHLDTRSCLYRVHTCNISKTEADARRRADLARCRMKSIELSSFPLCSEATRFNVFYELLTNLLLGDADEQTRLSHRPEFAALSTAQQARLLRLLASKSLTYCGDSTHIGGWLKRARSISPGDTRTALFNAVYSLSPRLCRLFLRARLAWQDDPRVFQPFLDIVSKTSLFTANSERVIEAATPLRSEPRRGER